MFWSKNKKNMYTPVYRVLLYKSWCLGVRITRTCFLMFTMYIKLDDLKQPFISIQVNTIQLLTIESLNMM